MPYSGFFRLKFGKAIFKFEISTLELIKIQKFVQNKKKHKSGIKNALFGYFWTVILKNYCHI